MKKIITLLLSITILFTTVFTIYADSASVSVSISPSTAAPGDTIQVTISVSGNTEGTSYSISSSYDSTLSCVGGTESKDATLTEPGDFNDSISFSLVVSNDAMPGTAGISGSCLSASNSATLTIICNHTWEENPSQEYLFHEATCNDAAIYYKSCSRCGEASNEKFSYGDKKEHKWIEVESNEYLAVAGDCYKNYPIYYKSCELCHSSGTETFRGKKFSDHDFVKEANSKYLVSNATCSSLAVYHSHCSMCGKLGDDFTAGTTASHSYDSWKELDKNYHVHKCTSCGHEEKEKHNWNEGVVKKKATVTEEGEIEYTCKVCHAKKTETIKKVNTREIEIPEIDADNRHYMYTGSEIEFFVPESDYYTVTGNKQINAGEYKVVVSLNNEDYLWENGKSKDLKYKFIIEKADYNLNDVEVLDKAVIGDGIKKYSLEVINVPSEISFDYNYKDVSQPGNYDVVVSFVGDNNHNAISDMKGHLYVLEQPVEDNKIISSSGSATGRLPKIIDFSITNLIENDSKYIDAKTEVIDNFDISEEKILGVSDLVFTYKGLVVEPISEVSVNMQIPENIDGSFKLYHVYIDDEGNKKCEPVDYQKENDGTITFTLNQLSQIVFVEKASISFLIPLIIGIDVLAVIGFVIYIISKKKKKNNEIIENEVKVHKESFITRLVNRIKENNAKRKEKARLAKEEKLAKKKAKEEEAARLAEEKRLAEEEAARLAEEERIAAEEKAKAEEARLAEEVRIAEEKRLAEETQKALENNLKVEETENEQIIIDDDLEEEVPETVKVKKESFITKLLNKIKDNKAKKKEKAELAKAAKEAARKEKEKKISDIKATSIYKIEDISDDDD